MRNIWAEADLVDITLHEPHSEDHPGNAYPSEWGHSNPYVLELATEGYALIVEASSIATLKAFVNRILEAIRE